MSAFIVSKGRANCLKYKLDVFIKKFVYIIFHKYFGLLRDVKYNEYYRFVLPFGMTPLNNCVKLWKICAQFPQSSFSEKISVAYRRTLSQPCGVVRGPLGHAWGGLRVC